MYYTSLTDGTKKSTSTMHYEYLVNALSKCQREIFEVPNVEKFNIMYHNIQVLEREIYERIDAFLKSKIDDERWLEDD